MNQNISLYYTILYIVVQLVSIFGHTECFLKEIYRTSSEMYTVVNTLYDKNIIHFPHRYLPHKSLF